MRKVKRIAIIFATVVLGIPVVIVTILFAVGVALYCTADFCQPDINIDTDNYKTITQTDSVRTCKYGSFILNKYGLWEAKLHGKSVDRGAAYGAMSQDLLEYQEDVFVEQIHEMVRTEWWVDILHKLVIVFNRNMAKYIPQEYREEIYAMSLFCTKKYDLYGTPYVRQLNYHAAHDIGHTMQEYMLVGCSSFATWGEESENKELLIGRNFDFYVGDNFAKNKLVLFVDPDCGYKFMSVSWPGMLGVLSGMNEKGLTVTINAAKGPIPISSAMPISLLARHILQYASNISEAYECAQQFKTFVSESILIGSALDSCAAIIEKTPADIALYQSGTNRIICTNHYQSDTYRLDKYNVENMAGTDSPYRFQRINELLNEYAPLTVTEAVGILRDRYGINDKDIGVGNEKSVNQFIAHHAVVFQPDKLLAWVSTSPWQLGEFVCYDLHDVFDTGKQEKSQVHDIFNIIADTAAINHDCVNVIQYRKLYKEFEASIDNKEQVSEQMINKFINSNPHYFQVYNTLGDYMLAMGDEKNAIPYWQKALLMEIPRAEERETILNKIQKYDYKQKSSLSGYRDN